ncbi:POK18 protein, partial [Larus smithsonianus]|nr:POK18 protein [Larus smithsonianus]
AQKLLGAISWVRPYLGLTDSQLAPCFDLLKGDSELTCPRKLTPGAKAALQRVEQAITDRQVHRICPEVWITVFILTVNFHPTGVIGQGDTHWPDPLHIL